MKSTGMAVDVRRVGLLMLNDVLLEGRGLLVGAGAVAAIVALLWGVFPVQVGEGSYSAFLFPLLLIAGGAVMSSRAFKRAHLPGFGIDYLMLPASTFEKFLARLLNTSIVYTVGVVLFVELMSLAVLGLLTAFGRDTGAIYNPLTLGTLKTAGAYLVVNALFVCGSLYFGKGALVKTALVLGAFMLFLGIYTSILGTNVFRDIGLEGWLRLKNFADTTAPSYGTWMDIARYGLFYVMAPLFWVVAFLRLRELEV